MQFIFAILFLALPSTLSLAQTYDLAQPLTANEQWRQEGQLVSVQISKGSPIRIFVVGREEIKIDPSTVDLTVRRIKPYPGKILNVDRSNNYFVISNPSEFRKTTELEIVTHVKDRKDEIFRFKLKQELP